MRPAEMLCQPSRIGDGRRAPHEGAQQGIEFGLEFFVALGLEIDLFQFVQRGHERFRHELAAVRAKVAGFVGPGGVVKFGLWCKRNGHQRFSRLVLVGSTTHFYHELHEF
jgi:hypothetical protein